MLGLTGLDNAKKLLALQGMGAGWNFQGSSFGTNFAMFLQRLSKGPEMIEMAKRGMKGLARETMQKAGIKFEFYDSKGKLKGIDQMVDQLQVAYGKLRKIGGDRAALDVFSTVFGAEAGRVAQMLAIKGDAGYRDAQKRLDDQASLDQRIQQTMKSAANIWTVFSTNVTNALAAFAQPAVEWLEPMVTRLGNVVAATRRWTEAHQTFAKWTMVVVGGLGLTLTTLGSIALTLGLITRLMGGSLSLLGRFPIGAVFRGITSGLGSLVRLVPIAVTGLRTLGVALLGIPGIGWIMAGITLVAFLVWKYWGPIKAFLGGLWDGLVKGAAPGFTALGQALSALGGVLSRIFSPFMPLIHEAVASFKLMWSWIVALFEPVNSTGTAARGMGRSIGLAIGGAIRWVAKLYASMIAIPTHFIALGEQIVTGLVTGIARRVSSARDTIVQLGGNIKSWFAQTLGIHSPSRVFMELGRNIGEGAQIGMLSTVGALRGAASRLATSAVHGATAARLQSAVASAQRAGYPAQAAGAVGGHVIHYSPTLHVAGGPQVREQVEKAMQFSQAEFNRMLDRYFHDKTRTAF